jgi:hypothetical protein
MGGRSANLGSLQKVADLLTAGWAGPKGDPGRLDVGLLVDSASRWGAQDALGTVADALVDLNRETTSNLHIEVAVESAVKRIIRDEASRQARQRRSARRYEKAQQQTLDNEEKDPLLAADADVKAQRAVLLRVMASIGLADRYIANCRVAVPSRKPDRQVVAELRQYEALCSAGEPRPKGLRRETRAAIQRALRRVRSLYVDVLVYTILAVRSVRKAFASPRALVTTLVALLVLVTLPRVLGLRTGRPVDLSKASAAVSSRQREWASSSERTESAQASAKKPRPSQSGGVGLSENHHEPPSIGEPSLGTPPVPNSVTPAASASNSTGAEIIYTVGVFHGSKSLETTNEQALVYDGEDELLLPAVPPGATLTILAEVARGPANQSITLYLNGGKVKVCKRQTCAYSFIAPQSGELHYAAVSEWERYGQRRGAGRIPVEGAPVPTDWFDEADGIKLATGRLDERQPLDHFQLSVWSGVALAGFVPSSPALVDFYDLAGPTVAPGETLEFLARLPEGQARADKIDIVVNDKVIKTCTSTTACYARSFIGENDKEVSFRAVEFRGTRRADTGVGKLSSARVF